MSAREPLTTSPLIKELFKLEDNEYQEFLRVLSQANLGLDIVDSEDGPYVLFREDGKVSGIEAGIYGRSEPELVGFTLAQDHETPESFKARRKAHRDLEQAQAHRQLEIPSYSRVLLEAAIKSLKLKILKKHLRLDKNDMNLLLQGLKWYGLEPVADLSIKDFVVMLFQTPQGVYRPIPEGFLQDTAGWVIPIHETSNGRKRNPEAWANRQHRVCQQLTKKYQEIVGNSEATINLIDFAVLDEFIGAVRQELEENDPHLLPERQIAPEVVDKFIRQVQQYLRPFFFEKGLDLVIAKQIMKEHTEDRAIRHEFRTSTPFPLVDLLVVKRDRPGVDLDYVNLYGWGKSPNTIESSIKERSLTPYGNVCGLVLVSDNTSLSERKQLIRNAASQLRRYYPTQPKPMIVTVDPALLTAWKETNCPFPSETAVTEMVETTPVKKLVDFGIYPSSFNVNRAPLPTVELHIYEPEVSHIGGTQLTVVVKRDEKVSNAVLLDRGWIFDLVPSWGNIGKGPQYVEGLKSFLGSGMFDTTRRLYRLDLLINSMKKLNLGKIFDLMSHPAATTGFTSVEEFICLELFHRLGREQFELLVYELQPYFVQQCKLGKSWRNFLKFLETRHKELYAQKTIFDLAFLTHAHQDHSLGFSLIRDEVLRGFSGTTRAMLLADHKLSSNWLAQDVAVRKMRELPEINSAYPVYEFPYYLFENDTQIEVSPGVFVTSHEVYHSIPGTMAAVVEVKHKGQSLASVAYGGDYRDGRFFHRVGEMGGTDLLIVEGTNPPSVGERKASAHVTEKIVKDNFNQAFIEANSREDLVVIDLVKNAFERLENIIEIATIRGRSVVLSPKILKRLQLIHMITRGEQRLPVIHPDNPNIFVWKPVKGTYSLEEREMFELYGHITVSELNDHPDWYVLIRETEKPEKLEDLGHRVTWIDSTYGPYTESARHEKKDRSKFADRQGWTLLKTGFHATGHGPLMHPDQPHAEEAILAQLPAAKARKILPVHTQRRDEVAKVIKKYTADTPVIDRVRHPRGKITLFTP